MSKSKKTPPAPEDGTAPALSNGSTAVFKLVHGQIIFTGRTLAGDTDKAFQEGMKDAAPGEYVCLPIRVVSL